MVSILFIVATAAATDPFVYIYDAASVAAAVADLDQGVGTAESTTDVYEGTAAIRVTNDQVFASDAFSSSVVIRETPAEGKRHGHAAWVDFFSFFFFFSFRVGLEKEMTRGMPARCALLVPRVDIVSVPVAAGWELWVCGGTSRHSLGGITAEKHFTIDSAIFFFFFYFVVRCHCRCWSPLSCR